MADAPTLSPDAARSASTVARTLVAAARSWALYPPEHPAVAGALERFRAAITETGRGGILSFGVTPDTLLIAGALLTGGEAGGAADAARWLHDRDILQLTFVGDVGIHALQRLLAMLSEDPRLIRQRGGPARVWTESGDAAVAIQQIDFSHLLQDRTTAPSVRRKDDLWRSIVRGALTRTRPSDAASQTRLLDIAADPAAIAELAGDVIAPHHAADGSPMLTSQAAAVVTAYRHLVGIVDVLSPDRRHDVMRNIAAATATLDARVVMQMLGGSAEVTGSDGSGAGIVSGIIEAMDDTRVAELLATTLAIEGQASQRLATVFNTIVTDEDRKRRVLALTRRMLGDTAARAAGRLRVAGGLHGGAAAHLQRTAVRVGCLSRGTRRRRRAGRADGGRSARRSRRADRHARAGQRPAPVGHAAHRPAAPRRQSRRARRSLRGTSPRSSRICCSPATTNRRSPPCRRCGSGPPNPPPRRTRRAASRSTASRPRRRSRRPPAASAR